MDALRQNILIAFSCLASSFAQAQHMDNYTHTTPLEPYVVRYGHDVQAVNYFYGPMPKGRSYARYAPSPEQAERLLLLDRSYLDELEALDYQNLTIGGQVDYQLLTRKIARHSRDLQQNIQTYTRLEKYLSFAPVIYQFEQKRRRGHAVDAQRLATELHAASKAIQQQIEDVNQGKSIPAADVTFLTNQLESLQQRLTSAFDFYNTYEPEFTWWVPTSFAEVNTQLGLYQEALRAKSDWQVFDDGSQIGGQPIGKDALNQKLQEEMIAYNAEELLKIADKEWAWCVTELLKASREMGFGDDWQAAQEQVKNSFVPVGKQPELINTLYDKAQAFIKAKQLMDIPPLADETWGMIMMTPERQLVNPFFTGGREISISYPTQDMSYEQKMMSMRGNNPHFSLGTVQHELVPGHHLQYFMNRRYKPYREQHFNTPFWTEGWTLYWELLLYRMGFAQSPEERIGMLFWRMHRCARITFSIKFHLGEWTPQQCIDYLVNEVGHEPANAHGEVKRSFEGSYDPLYQLAYMIGGLQLLSISDELVGSGKMSYEVFHDRVIKENYLPMEMLRAILTEQQVPREYSPIWKFYPTN